MRIALDTHGCRLNQFETEAMEQALAAAGHELVDEVERAEVYVLNSCTVTSVADADARKSVRRARRKNPDVSVVVTGCYATGAPEKVAKLDGVSLVLGNVDKDEIVRQLGVALRRSSNGAAGSGQEASTKGSNGPLISVESLTRGVRFSNLPPALQPRRHTRAYLKVQDGCDYRCSFCVVPSVRGPSRSIEPQQAAAQVAALVEAGRPEVVLTGVHLGTYGRDLVGSTRFRFVDLLRAILARLGASRLRLSSLDPHEVEDELLDLLSTEAGRICRHLHLPLQSGDAGVLKAMRRAHTVADIEQLLPRLARAVPGIAIGSDVIVGFPGETREAFDRTYAFVEQMPVSYAHVFSYSEREGTHAATLADVVPVTEKKRRSAALRSLCDRKWRAFREACCERIWPVVVERARPTERAERVEGAGERGQLVGLTDNYIRVSFRGPAHLVGRTVGVELLQVERDQTRGRLAPDN